MSVYNKALLEKIVGDTETAISEVTASLADLDAKYPDFSLREIVRAEFREVGFQDDVVYGEAVDRVRNAYYDLYSVLGKFFG